MHFLVLEILSVFPSCHRDSRQNFLCSTCSQSCAISLLWSFVMYAPAGLSSLCCGMEDRGHPHMQMVHENFSLNIRNTFLFYSEGDQTQKVVSQKVVKSPSLVGFKTWLDIIQDHWLNLPVLEQGVWTKQSPRVPSHLSNPLILWP